MQSSKKSTYQKHLGKFLDSKLKYLLQLVNLLVLFASSEISNTNNIPFMRIDNTIYLFYFIFDWDSHHERLDSNGLEAWSYRKKKHKKIKNL